MNISTQIQTLQNQGITLGQSGDLQGSIKYFKKILKLDKNNISVIFNLGTSYEKLCRYKLAQTYYKKVIAIDPTFPNSHFNLAIVFKKQNKLDEAIDELKTEIRNQPNHINSLITLGIIYSQKYQASLARKYYEKVLSLNPEHKATIYNYEWALRDLCEWSKLKQIEEKISKITTIEIKNRVKPGEHPLTSIIKTTNQDRNFQIARLWSQELKKPALDTQKLIFHKNNLKIKIAYISGDFHNHPTMHLIGKAFAYHDRTKFEIFTYSCGRSDNSKYRNWITSSVDHFRELSTYTDFEIANLINQDKIDILIDLSGYTKNGRMGVLAYKPAPIQISWLGFPGSTGADFVDYLITDKITSPLNEAQNFYREKLIYLPNCYQIADGYRLERSVKITRKTLNFPEDKFIFCNFGQSYKITPEVFSIWMNILKKVPNSVLYLFTLDAQANSNLKKEAAIHGVNPRRLRFAEFFPKANHLARLSLCDLALDTYPCNGHTTTTDSIWAGTPVLTMKGNHFASRVSESILNQVGLENFVASSLNEYEAFAVSYVKSNQRKEIKEKLKAAKSNSKLFDTKEFISNFEKLLINCHNKHMTVKSSKAYQFRKGI